MEQKQDEPRTKADWEGVGVTLKRELTSIVTTVPSGTRMTVLGTDGTVAKGYTYTMKSVERIDGHTAYLKKFLTLPRISSLFACSWTQ